MMMYRYYVPVQQVLKINTDAANILPSEILYVLR